MLQLWGLLPSNQLMMAVRQGLPFSLGRVILPRPVVYALVRSSVRRVAGTSSCCRWCVVPSFLCSVLCSFLLLKGPSPCYVYSFFLCHEPRIKYKQTQAPALVLVGTPVLVSISMLCGSCGAIFLLRVCRTRTYDTKSQIMPAGVTNRR